MNTQTLIVALVACQGIIVLALVLVIALLLWMIIRLNRTEREDAP